MFFENFATLGYVARETHWDGGEEAESFFDNCVEVEKLIKGGGGVRAQFLV